VNTERGVFKPFCKHVVLVRDKLFIDGMLYCQDENDNENTNATSAKKYGYRDSLLTSIKLCNISLDSYWVTT
jgi:hypothetical protein